jgi:hypothetical protein
MCEVVEDGDDDEGVVDDAIGDIFFCLSCLCDL